ncbi:carbohydrate kinase family protein [Marinilabiliaceae bacterium JC017]|nr:carbohydrate kinase family protein [Marinilabiliaceae bacterium JC017]
MVVKKRNDILVAGDLNVDLLYNDLSNLPQTGEEVLAGDFNMALGSSAGIMAANIAALGVNVAFVGVVGNDLFGQYIIDQLKQKNVSTQYVKVRENFSTGSTVVMNQGQERANLTHAGAMASLCIEDFPWEEMKRISFFHLANPFVLPQMRNNLLGLFDRAKDCGMITSLDPQWDVKDKWDMDLKGLLPQVDYFFPNEKEFALLTKSQTVGEGIQSLEAVFKHVVITRGVKGSVLYTPGHRKEQGAVLNNQVVDCIGAGDAFCAGFLAAKIDGLSDTDALKSGAITGALSTTIAGGAGAFNSKEEFLQKAEELLG